MAAASPDGPAAVPRRPAADQGPPRRGRLADDVRVGRRQPRPGDAVGPGRAAVRRTPASCCSARPPPPSSASCRFTESDALGISRNPWDPDRTPGGSSSGAGAAVAAGMAPHRPRRRRRRLDPHPGVVQRPRRAQADPRPGHQRHRRRRGPRHQRRAHPLASPTPPPPSTCSPATTRRRGGRPRTAPASFVGALVGGAPGRSADRRPRRSADRRLARRPAVRGRRRGHPSDARVRPATTSSTRPCRCPRPTSSSAPSRDLERRWRRAPARRPRPRRAPQPGPARGRPRRSTRGPTPRACRRTQHLSRRIVEGFVDQLRPARHAHDGLPPASRSAPGEPASTTIR